MKFLTERRQTMHAVPIFGNRLQKAKPVNNRITIHCMSLGSNLPFTSELVTSGQHFLLIRVLARITRDLYYICTASLLGVAVFHTILSHTLDMFHHYQQYLRKNFYLLKMILLLSNKILLTSSAKYSLSTSRVYQYLQKQFHNTYSTNTQQKWRRSQR